MYVYYFISKIYIYIYNTNINIYHNIMISYLFVKYYAKTSYNLRLYEVLSIPGYLAFYALINL